MEITSFIALFLLYLFRKQISRNINNIQPIHYKEYRQGSYLVAAERRIRISRKRFLKAKQLRRKANRERDRQRWLALVALGIGYGFTVERKLWVKKRLVGDFWLGIVGNTFTPDDWRHNFRMSKPTFEYLCEQLHSTLYKPDSTFRLSLSVRLKVAVTLWRLATNCEFRTIGHLFGISSGTACIIVKETCAAIVKVLMKKYIKFPSGQYLREVVAGFEDLHGFPQCGGAIDGTHIPILAPKQYHKDYYNRKGFYSISMQAVCDHQYLFTDVYIGWPGKVHDARVFVNSPLYQKGEENNLFPNWCKEIGGVQMPIMLLGDPAYPLLPWLLKGFSDTGRLTPDQVNFNYRLSKARMVIEGTFGRLKGRWRCLLKRNDTNTEAIPTQIAACCVLHNLCEISGETMDEALLEDTYAEEEAPLLNAEAAAAAVPGVTIRNALMDYFVR